MGKLYDTITPELADWIRAQHLFFVSTAPLAGDGLINCSPKGMDTLRILGPRQVAFLDLTGSGIETVAHLRENGRIIFMFCALTGLPKIVRLHGQGEIITRSCPDWAALRPLFPDYPGDRAIIRTTLTRISDSCGFAVPRFDYVGERDTLIRVTKIKGAGLQRYLHAENAHSIEGLPGLDPE